MCPQALRLDCVDNVSTLKNIESELTLSEKEPICLMLHGDPQKWR
jgi:hypothetical protein